MAGRFFDGRWVAWVDVTERPASALCPVCEERFALETWPGTFRVVPREHDDRYDAVATCSEACALR